MESLDEPVRWQGSPESAERAIVAERERIERFWPKVTPSNSVFFGLSGCHRELAQNLLVLSRIPEAIHELRHWAWYRHWWYRLQLLDATQSVELPLLGSDLTVVLTARQDAIEEEFWLVDLTLALLIDDRDFVDLLLGWDRFEERLTNPRLKTIRPRAAVWRSFFCENSDILDRLEDAERSAPVEESRLDPDMEHTDPLMNERQLVRAVVEGAQSDFDRAVVSAHRQHVEHYSLVDESGERLYGNKDIAVNKPISVLINEGVRRGLAPPPKSPYFADWASLVEGLTPIAPGYEPG